MDEDEGQGEDGATRAFAQLGREVSLLRAAVEGLTAARESIEIPDYEPTLERTEKVLGILVQQIDGVRKSPAMTLTPEKLGERVNASVASATGELRNLVHTTKSTLDSAARDLSGLVVSARRGDEQNRWLLWSGLSGMALGMLLWAVFAGIVARVMPNSWHWPERMATRTLAEPTMWGAGQRLLARASPASWEVIIAADPLADENREAIEACRISALKVRKAVRCTIEIKPKGE